MRILNKFHRLKLFLLTVFLSILLAACSSTKPYELELMPAPDIFSESSVQPFTQADFNHAVPYEGMLYATDRQPAPQNSPKEEYYENHRGHMLRLGVGTIELDKGQYTWNEIKEISTQKNRKQKYPLRVSGIKEFGVLDSSRGKLIKNPGAMNLVSANKAFASAINRKLSTSKVKDIYIYVHGYKIVFVNPLLIATELWHYLDYQGVFIAYSWPATPNTLAYARDLETAAYSSRNLRLLIEYLASSTKVHRIHVIAHSAGTRVATEALAQLALISSANRSKEKYRIGKVILIGSDMDRDIFSAYVEDGLLQIPESLTLYLSESDRALGLSRFLFTRQRVGQVFSPGQIPAESIEFLRKNPRLEVIDVTGAENYDAERGHDYFRRSPWVSSDVLATLKYRLTPKNRGLIWDDALAVWKFPNDYIDQLARKLSGRVERD